MGNNGIDVVFHLRQYRKRYIDVQIKDTGYHAYQRTKRGNIRL